MSLRLPLSLEPFLVWSQTEERDIYAKRQCVFESNAEMAAVIACYGFHRTKGSVPSLSEMKFLEKDPIPFRTLKRSKTYNQVLIMALAATKDAQVISDEDRICRIVEAFSDVGARELYDRCVRWMPEMAFIQIALEITGETGGPNENQGLEYEN